MHLQPPSQEQPPDREFRCGVTEHEIMRAAASGPCKMPIDEIWLRFPKPMPGFDHDMARSAAQAGVDVWAKYVKLTFHVEITPSPHQVHMEVGRIDGPWNVIAWSMLPCPWVPPLQQRYDSEEPWSLLWPAPAGRVSWPFVVCHEVGHALGIGHINKRGNVMHPNGSDAPAWDLGPDDIREIQKRYTPQDPGGEPPQPPGEPDMNKLLECLFAILPQFLACLFEQQQDAITKGEEGPLEALARLTKKRP